MDPRQLTSIDPTSINWFSATENLLENGGKTDKENLMLSGVDYPM
jgi:hypothetical protein